MMEMSRKRFEELVADALDTVPKELADLMDNVVIFVEDDGPVDDPHLLGLYEGVPLTDRDAWYGTGTLPDRISIFRAPILARCETEGDVVHEVRVTVVHEIAHHFGIDDDRLDELGYS